MNKKYFGLLIFSWFFYFLVVYSFANTIYIAFALNSRSNLVSGELYFLLIVLAFAIIYFVLCFIVEPGEVKESISIQELSEENKYIPTDSIDKKYLTRAKIFLCTDCRLCRPPHAYHCETCKKCILYHYHHNCLFGKCIGYYNFKFHANLLFYIGIGLIIVFLLDLEIMKNTKTPYYGIDLVFMFICSVLIGIWYLIQFLDMIKAAVNISYLLKEDYDIYGSTSWYENFRIFFGKNFWTWFLPIRVPLIKSLAIDLRLNTHYGGVIKLSDKFIV